MKCSDMCAGALRERIGVYRKTLTPDGRGGFTDIWALRVSVRARVDSSSASVRFFAQGHEDAATHRFVIRYRDDIDSTDVILWRGEAYSILRPIDIEARRRWLLLEAKLSRLDEQALKVVTFDTEPVTFGEEIVIYA